MKTLKGITWNHTRGYAPLAVTSKAWNDFHPDVTIQWEIRSLWSFGEEGLEQLAREYDLLLVDHPFMGTASRLGLFVPLDEHMPAEELAQLRSQSVGRSFDSYEYDGHVWALAVDAAAQGSVARMDWFIRENRPLPSSWEDVLTLAKETGKVAMPMAPMGLLGAFFSLYANQFEPPFTENEDWNMDAKKATFVLDQLASLCAIIGPDYLKKYPVELLNRMAQTDDAERAPLVYMPITYGYATYGMAGYAEHPLTFGPLPGSRPDGATLGGVGIAVSASSKHIETAIDYCRWIASAACQSTLYGLSGGQPANRVAWESSRAASGLLNQLTNQFYQNTLETIEKAFMRPRFDGFHHFQTEAAPLLQQCLMGTLKPDTVFQQWETLYSTARYAINY